MTSSEKSKLEDVVVEGVRQKLKQLIEEASAEWNVLWAKEQEEIKTGHMPNNHWQPRWRVEQRIQALMKALHALD